MKLLDKVAIITGAASGIGKATAEQFGKEGAIVVIADLPTSPGIEVAGRIEESGGPAQNKWIILWKRPLGPMGKLILCITMRVWAQCQCQ